jgi:hypothetical protein
MNPIKKNFLVYLESVVLFVVLTLAAVGWNYHGNNRPYELDIAFLVCVVIFLALKKLYCLRRRRGTKMH